MFYPSIKRIERVREKCVLFEKHSRGKYPTKILSAHSRLMHVDCMLDEFQWI